MLSHDKSKTFWSFCIMFVTDNNSFDAMTIDYIEYSFINKLKKIAVHTHWKIRICVLVSLL